MYPTLFLNAYATSVAFTQRYYSVFACVNRGDKSRHGIHRLPSYNKEETVYLEQSFDQTFITNTRDTTALT
jgi:hypothetical protein